MKKYIFTHLSIIIILLISLIVLYTKNNHNKINIIKNEDANKINVLVNKHNKLNPKYIPQNLVLINELYATKNQYLRIEAYKAFIKMQKDANKSNIYFYIGSGYRSYKYQKWLYNKYRQQKPINIVNKYSAKAGFSEHQTGLAIDIINKEWKYLNENNKEYTWLINNSYKYGYILRYPKNKEKITEYNFEPWHFRYFGPKIAKTLYNNNLTYEEYILKKIDNN